MSYFAPACVSFAEYGGPHCPPSGVAQPPTDEVESSSPVESVFWHTVLYKNSDENISNTVLTQNTAVLTQYTILTPYLPIAVVEVSLCEIVRDDVTPHQQCNNTPAVTTLPLY